MDKLFERLASDPTHGGWETLAAFATVCAAIIAVGALIGVAFQVHGGRITEREATAHNIWMDYLKLAFENPEFAAPSLSALRVDGRLEKYEWFVSVVLFGAEQILMSHARHRPWGRIIIDQMRYHIEYIQSRQFRELYYPHSSRQVRRALDQACALGPFAENVAAE